jgi:HWE histidine kinase
MRKDGGWIDISLTISPMRDAGGKIIGASKIARDITEQKRSEAQIAILAREAEHRAKNLLTTVQATVHLTQADTLEGFKHAIAGRIQALANVNSLFVQSRWKGAELRSLVTQELAPYYENEGTRVQIAGPDLLLDQARRRRLPSSCMSWRPTPPSLEPYRRSKGASKSSGRVPWTSCLFCAGSRLTARWSSHPRITITALARA